MAERKTERFNDLPTGWSRVGLQVPDALADQFAQARDLMPGKISKLVGTAALSVFVALPRDVQQMLYKWAHFNELQPEEAEPHEALTILLTMMEGRRIETVEKNIAPLHSTEKGLVAKVLHMVGDGKKKAYVEQVVKTMGIRDLENEERRRLEEEAMRRSVENPANFLKAGDGGEPPLPSPETHQVTRILDPEITLPTGSKPSEAGQRRRKKKDGVG